MSVRRLTFEWDEAKAAANLRKHDVAFEVAARVWSDPRHLVVFDRIVDDEERWHAIGLVGAVVILTVVHTDRGDDTIRIISARKAVPEERRRYDDDTV